MTYSQEKPKRWERLGLSLWRYNYEIVSQEDGFTFKSTIFDHIPNYGEIINEVIKNEYPHGGENAIQRKGIADPKNKEFLTYNLRVQEIKAEVKEVLNEIF